ncbi:prominin-1-A-like isoform X2 [Centruroides vittatus]|uniref:prominin-1-A-like isoform X2 n=1 Tax=Centruroides vittatus TaxID=120091 RepID=UPI003510417D
MNKMYTHLYIHWAVLLPLALTSGQYANESSTMLHFSHAMIVPEYQESHSFDPRGMEHLYTITNMFLDLIQKDGLPPVIVTNEIFKTPLKVIDKNRGELFSHFLGMLLIAVIGLVLAIILPISGLLFCCCRCAGKCGSKKNVPEQRRDSCRRIVWGTVMFLILLAMMFGVVCAFVTNEYIEHGVNSLPWTLKDNIGDVNLYLNNTKSEINHLLKKNFQQLQMKLGETLDKSGETVKDRLGEVTQAAAVNNLTEIVSRLGQVQNRLKKAVQYTEQLYKASNQLQTHLTDIKEQLIEIQKRCTSDSCQEQIKQYNTSAFSVATNVYKFPNLSYVFHNISTLLNQNIETEIKEGKIAFDKLSDTIQKAVNKTIPDIKHKISLVGSELSTAADNITLMLRFPQLNQAESYIVKYEPLVKEYSKYRWYACIGFCCGMLSIVMCFAFGLICGTCGQQPGNIYSDNTCNKGAGADFLLLGVGLLFLFSFLLLIAMTALFLIGGTTEKVICDLVSNSSNPQLRQLIELIQDQEINHPSAGERLDIIHMLHHCHKNESLYHALGFEQHRQIRIGHNIIQMMNFSEIRNYRQNYQVDEKLEEFLHQLSISPNVTVLTPQGEELLQRLKDTPFSAINFSVYFEMDKKQVTSIDIPDVIRQLQTTITLIPASEHEVKNNLKNITKQLELYQRTLIASIHDTLDQLQKLGEQLQKDTRVGNRTIQEALPDLLQQAQTAQEFIQTKGKEEIKRLAKEFITEFTGLMDQYAFYVQQQVENNIGKCGPISQAFNTSIIATCSEILLPFNGFWASLGCCTLLCIPGLIVAVILSVLYRRIEPYPGPLVDSVNRKRGERQIYENRNGYIHDYSPGYQEASVSFLPNHADYPRDVGSTDSTAFANYQPLRQSSCRTTPTAPADFSPTQDYIKPPPYYFPGP